MIHKASLPATGAVFNLDFGPWISGRRELFRAVPVQLPAMDTVFNLDFGAGAIKSFTKENAAGGL
jgi:hypothetical protein